MITLLNSDARYMPLADQSVHCAITSPPYWGLRDYGTARWEGGEPNCDHSPASTPMRRGLSSSTLQGGKETTGHQREGYKAVCARCGAVRIDNQIGLEPTPDLYVEHIVACMREVWRVLRPEGTLWIVLGDSYAGAGYSNHNKGAGFNAAQRKDGGKQKHSYNSGLKNKDLCMIPARVALALQADGWYLRSDIIWAKSNPMPESVMDRPTKAHEYVFLLSKAERYYYDAEAIKEPAKEWTGQAATFERENGKATELQIPGQAYASHRPNRKVVGNFSRKYAEQQTEHGGMQLERGDYSNGRNKRSVWTIATKRYSVAHFAVFPEDLVEPMILAGTSARGCCPACGAPWVRVMKRKRIMRHELPKEHPDYRPGRYTVKSGGNDDYAKGGGQAFSETETLGWRPSCDCNGAYWPDYPPEPRGKNGDALKETNPRYRKWLQECELVDAQRLALLDQYKDWQTVPAVVLDPFSGTATVGRVCVRHGRRFVGGELNREYIALAHERTSGVQMELDA